MENDEAESLLAAFPDWETREVGKATSPKPILKKVKRFVNREERPKKYFLGCFGEMGGEWICLGVVDLLGIISFFLVSLVVRKLVVGYLKDTNAGE